MAGRRMWKLVILRIYKFTVFFNGGDNHMIMWVSHQGSAGGKWSSQPINARNMSDIHITLACGDYLKGKERDKAGLHRRLLTYLL